MIYASVEIRCIYTDLNFGLASIGTQCISNPYIYLSEAGKTFQHVKEIINVQHNNLLIPRVSVFNTQSASVYII